MGTWSRTPRQARQATAVALVSFVGYLVVPSVVRPVVLVVMVVAAAVVVACAAAWMRSGTARVRRAAWLAIVSAVGLVGSVLYLSSLADEPTAIPVVGTLVLLLSLVG